jgi:hypothetical protein
MRPNDYGGFDIGTATLRPMTPTQLPVAAALAAALMICGACGSADDAKAGPSPSAQATPKTKLIEFDQDDAAGLTIAKPADVSKLEGAPDDFKQFIAGIIDGLKTPPDEDCQFTVGVARLDTSGFAAGNQHSCGGAAFIWAKRDGVWQEIWSGQEAPDCVTMEKYSVPKTIVGGQCFDAEKEGHADYSG